MKQRMKWIGAVLALLLALTGCGTPSAGMPQAVTPLTCAAPTGYPEVSPAGGYDVVLCWADYEKEETYLRRIDVREDRVTAERTIAGAWSMIERSFADGQVALRQWGEEDMTYRLLDERLEDAGEFVPENGTGELAHDGRTYYFLKDMVLYRQDTVTGETERVTLDQDLRFTYIENIHPTENRLLLWCRLSPWSERSGSVLADPDSGKCLMVQETSELSWFLETGLCQTGLDETGAGYYIRYAAGDGSYRQAEAEAFGAEASGVMPVSGSRYAISTGEDRTVLFRLGQAVERCEPEELLAQSGVTGQILGMYWLPEAQVLLGTAYDQTAETFRLAVLDPARLSFTACGEAAETASPLTVDESIANVYWGELAGQPLPEDMAALRAYADRLEEKYDVDIRLSSQCAEPCQASAEEIVTTDAAGLADEAAAIYPALEALDRTLALYPQGFFAQFRNELGEGGIQFLPVAAFHMDFSVIGLAFQSPGWYHVAYQVDAGSPEELLCHEIWHATENRLLDGDWAAIDSEAWNACNPAGFAYTFDYDQAMNDADSRWLYFGEATDVHFVDAYSTMDPKEDRARLMEYIVGSDDYADSLMQYPAMRQKLTILAEAVRAGFDTTGWGVPRWERPLAQYGDAAA